MADEIHIVFAADDRYVQHAAVAMASILLHAAAPERFHFFVLDDGVTAEKREKMEKTVAALGGNRLTFLSIEGKAFDD
ncbi:MAG: glycosyltransferase, partial [Negativicutes bacterium]